MSENKPVILIVDDDDDVRTQMKWALAQQYNVLLAEDRKGAIDNLKHHRPAVVTLDLGLPPSPGDTREGFATLADLLHADPSLKVIVITGQDEKGNGMQAIGHGAYDFFCKPVKIDELSGALARAMRVSQLEREHRHHMASDQFDSFEGILGNSRQIQSVFANIRKMSASDASVLITGESGTGKELVARAIHRLSVRKDGPFIAINCGAIPENLLESELFGHEKGSFTGAHMQRQGRIETAEGGTLFLDEIGDLPIDVQPKILRFLQEGEVQPIGEKKPIKVDVRVIAATNMPLEEKVESGTFREDLYYRLNVIRLRVPPLRERRSEIPPIVNYYIDHYSARFGKTGIVFTPQTVDLLMVCEWEGNVRQLCNELQRIIARAVDGDIITPEQLSPELKRSARPLTAFGDSPTALPIMSFDSPVTPFANIPRGGTLEDAVSELEMQMIKVSLSRNNWNISRVANELGLTRRGLYLKLSRYGIEKAA